MKYYEVYSEDVATLLGVASSTDFRFFNDKGILLNCTEDKAQYISLNNELYGSLDLYPEPEDKEGNYKSVILKITSKDRYIEYINSLKAQEKAKMEKVLSNEKN